MKRMTMTIDNGTKTQKKSLSSKPPKKSRTSAKKNKESDPRKKKRIVLIGCAILLLFICTGGWLVYRANKTLGFMGINTDPTATIGNMFMQKEPELQKDENNRTNILLAGIDTRPSNPGLQNTDTIIVASYDHDTNEGIMLSLPRDLWVGYPDNPSYFTKINGIYNYCEAQEEGSGLPCLANVAETITSLDIHYYGMVDIGGLVEVIDLIGGVDVEVERSFTDYMFPTASNTWEAVSFEEGLQHMDGETAMKYARSRHAQGPEGSDFARARRQQRLILAAKEKVLSLETFKNPLTLFEVAEQLGESITFSDITTEDIRAGLSLAEKIDNDKIYSFVLDPSAGNWTLITEDPSAAYVLFPKAGEGQWEDVQAYLEIIFDNPGLYSEKPRVYLYNGGLGYNEAYQKFTKLTRDYPYLSFTFGGNASLQTYTGNSIYNFADEPALSTLGELSDHFETDWSSELPEGLIAIYGEDITVILGAPVEPELNEMEQQEAAN